MKPDAGSPLRVGDTVRWTSGARGVDKTKTGQIVMVLQPGENPPHYTDDFFAGRKRMFDSAITYRRTVSYIVEVARGLQAKPRLYWPTTKLERVVEI